jgi:hypothetical protein
VALAVWMTCAWLALSFFQQQVGEQERCEVIDLEGLLEGRPSAAQAPPLRGFA